MYGMFQQLALHAWLWYVRLEARDALAAPLFPCDTRFMVNCLFVHPLRDTLGDQ